MPIAERMNLLAHVIARWVAPTDHVVADASRGRAISRVAGWAGAMAAFGWMPAAAPAAEWSSRLPDPVLNRSSAHSTGVGGAGKPSPSAESLVNFDVVAMPPDSLGRVELAAVFRIERGWHLYWRNPGDSGMAPTVAVKCPPGWSVSELRWPAPKRFGGDDETTFGYDGAVTLFLTLTPPKDAGAGRAVGESTAPPPVEPLSVELSATWMVCKSICLTGGRSRAVRIGAPAAAHPLATTLGDVITQSRAALPAVLPRDAVSLSREQDGRRGVARIRVGEDALRAGAAGTPPSPASPIDPAGVAVEFFPFLTPGVTYGAPAVTTRDDGVEIAVPFEVNPGNALGQPLLVAGLVQVVSAAGKPGRSFEFTRPIADQQPNRSGP